MKIFLIKPSLFILFFCFFVFAASAQTAAFGEDELEGVYHTWEVNVTAGANNFLGDVGGTQGAGGYVKDYTVKTIRPFIGASLDYNISYWAALKGGVNFTMVTGADSLIKNTGGLEKWRYNRNLSFRSSIIEAFVGVDLYPVLMFDKENEIHPFSPVLGIGVGVFHFNPQAQLNGQWVALQPLHLEGQGFAEYPARHPYSLTQLYIPINIGFKYYLDNHLALSGGMLFRHTFTDYIDDISTTYIDPALFDKYLSADQAALAKQLYARPKDAVYAAKIRPDIEKAHSNDMDTYVTLYVTLSVRFNKHVVFRYGGR